MTNVPAILFGALQRVDAGSTRQEVIEALGSQEPERTLNFEHALRGVELWEVFLAGGQTFHSVKASPVLALQLVMRELYLDSISQLPFKWNRNWRLWYLPADGARPPCLTSA